MTYIENRKNKRSKKILALLVFIIVVVYAVIRIFAPHFFPALFSSLAVPFWRAEFSIQSGSLSSVSDLLAENESLKRELVGNAIRMDIVQFIESENAELRSLLGSATSSQILVAILKRPPIASYDEFIIDAGKGRGLSTSSIVYANENIPIGMVDDVFDETSKVVLFTSPGQKHDVLIGESRIPAQAVGRGGGQYEAELPRGLDIKEGDFVVSASLDARPIGKVISIDSNPSLTFERVLFSAPLNIYQLRWVFVEVKN